MEKLRRKVYDILREYRHMREVGYMPYLEMAVHTTALENFNDEYPDLTAPQAYRNMSWFIKLPLLIMWGKNYLLNDLDDCMQEILQDKAEDYAQRKAERFYG